MDDLQFDKAEYSGPSGIGNCVMCARPIHDTYWHANGQNICGDCATTLQQAKQAPERSLITKGALYALGAAIGCAIAYAAILIITNYELALISIAVGWLVGKAARIGTGGLGGRPVQIVAVIATYMAISGSLFFQILYSFFKDGKVVSGPASYLMLFFISMGKPFFELQEGFGGLLGLAILFFGLQQAWQQTRAIQITLAGPYTHNGN
jgi:hypothetical protein